MEDLLDICRHEGTWEMVTVLGGTLEEFKGHSRYRWSLEQMNMPRKGLEHDVLRFVGLTVPGASRWKPRWGFPNRVLLR